MASLAIVTGASKGFGRALSLELARLYHETDFFLVARDQKGLEDTGEMLKELLSQKSAVSLHQIDLSDLDNLEHELQELFSKINPQKYEKAFLFNNAGIVGEQVNARDYSLRSLRQNVDLSVTSSVYITSVFLRTIKPLPKDGRAGCKSAVVVDVSSLAAVQPFDSWGQYCTGRAARDMFHRCVASEENSSGVRTLNYAPGPMETAMTRAVRESDAPLASFFKDMHEKGQMIDPARSAKKLVRLLQEDTFESGAHIDFFDLPE
eukprot:CAMPEP_0196659098 /NCGR_PEP_ID=MMETSP1086-20130531/33078_1 /TAXON_ID=77921 /ORGANISM="Cyanoptyche  gloeocystis , Strain SAG4.97" /LENGTH=262 /DNA_ID=CAMNT_0041992943 /DNA_START=77 /DNA_END=865 /DNA_ORIENTATION=+